jgi:hypothetical protein
MKLVLLKAFKSTDRGNRNLTYYLEGSRTNRYTISVIPDRRSGDGPQRSWGYHQPILLLLASHWSRTNIPISEV